MLINDVGLVARNSVDDSAMDIISKRWLAQAETVGFTWNQLLARRAEHMVKLREKLRKKGKTLLRNIRIKACAVWDTVRSTHARRGRELRHVDFAVCNNIDYAFHALALNERRSKFRPKLWHRASGQKLKQCWFLGHHSDVGGGNANNGAANLSLLWMIEQLSDMLQFDDGTVQQITSAGILTNGVLHLEDSFVGPWADTTLGVNARMNKSEPRAPGCGDIKKDGRPVDAKNPTCETVHWSVSALIRRGPRTTPMVAGWSVDPLNIFTYSVEDGWQRSSRSPEKPTLVIDEERITRYEFDMLYPRGWIQYDAQNVLRFVPNQGHQPNQGMAGQALEATHVPYTAPTEPEVLPAMFNHGALGEFPHGDLHAQPVSPTISSDEDGSSSSPMPAWTAAGAEWTQWYTARYGNRYPGTELLIRWLPNDNCYEFNSGVRIRGDGTDTRTDTRTEIAGPSRYYGT